MENKYTKLKDIYYSLNNIGKIILLKPNENNVYSIEEEIENDCKWRASKDFEKYYIASIEPYIKTINFDFNESVRVDAKLRITIFKEVE